MDYILALIEGIVTFVSPCLLPMLPIYVSYFAGGQDSKRRTMLGALGFVLGFTLVFVSLGAFAGSVGHLLREYALAINLVTGAVVVLFGLNYLGLLRLPLLNKVSGIGSTPKNPGFFLIHTVRHDLFHQLDTLRRHIPGFGPHAGGQFPECCKGHPDAAALLLRAGHPFHHIRLAAGQAERNLRFSQASSWHHQHRIRPVACACWPGHDDGNAEQASGLSLPAMRLPVLYGLMRHGGSKYHNSGGIL